MTTTTDKLTAEVRRAVAAAAAADELIPVYFELHGENPAPPPGSRAERVAFLTDDFSRHAGSLAEALTAAGAKQVRLLWISRAVAASVPATEIERAAADVRVKRVALDRPIPMMHHHPAATAGE